VVFGEGDHTAVEELPDGTVKVIHWADDPADWPMGQRWAVEHFFAPLQPDPSLRGAINTKQTRVIYGEPAALERLRTTAPTDNFKEWSEFVPPAPEIVRHGIWMTDGLMTQHRAMRRQVGYKDAPFTNHLSREEVDAEGRLKPQRVQGRFLPNTHTITYICRDTDRAAGWESATHEDAFELTTAAAATETREIPNSTPSTLTWIFSTPSNEPNSNDWPTGDYRIQYDVTVVDSGVFIDASSFRRVSSDLSATLASLGSEGTNITTTGLHLRSITVNPFSGDAVDRFGVGVFCGNSNSHGSSQTITLELNTSDSFADGPWEGVQTFTYAGSGGAALGGAAALAKNKVFTASGGLTAAGVAALAKNKVFTASGGLTAAGVAVTSLSGATNTFTYSASGGAALGGAATLVKIKALLASGGMTLGGAAAAQKSKVYIASGGLALGGAAALAKVRAYSVSGGLVLGGAASLAKGRVFVASGGLVAGGAASTVYESGAVNTYTYAGAGGAALGGVAITSYEEGVFFTVGGGSVTVHRPPLRPKPIRPRIREYSAAGGAVMGGAARSSVLHVFTASPRYRLSKLSGESAACWVQRVDVEDEEFLEVLRAA
jgi:hypothetical protein